nr:MAG TPA: hypothetical protein [Caudoviricetes sp.]
MIAAHPLCRHGRLARAGIGIVLFVGYKLCNRRKVKMNQ